MQVGLLKPSVKHLSTTANVFSHVVQRKAFCLFESMHKAQTTFCLNARKSCCTVCAMQLLHFPAPKTDTTNSADDATFEQTSCVFTLMTRRQILTRRQERTGPVCLVFLTPFIGCHGKKNDARASKFWCVRQIFWRHPACVKTPFAEQPPRWLVPPTNRDLRSCVVCVCVCVCVWSFQCYRAWCVCVCVCARVVCGRVCVSVRQSVCLSVCLCSISGKP